MNRESLERVLLLVRHEMSADNARLEIGGDPPDSAEVLCAQTPSGFRLVVVFKEPPFDRASANLRLRQLASSFFDSGLTPPSIRPDPEQNLNQRRLDDELYALAGRTGALGAVVFDVQSPVIWGSSEGRPQDEDLDTWKQIAKADEFARARGLDLAVISGLVEAEQSAAIEALPAAEKSQVELVLLRLAGRSLKVRKSFLLRARATREVRKWAKSQDTSVSLRSLSHAENFAYFTRSLGGIYLVLLYFQGTFSELHVEGMALHALPVIERLVLGLPPIDPPPSKGKVVQLPLR